MTIKGNLWNEVANSRQQLSLKRIRAIVATDRPDPCVAIDAMLFFVQAFKACWAGKIKSGTITAIEPIIKSSIEKCIALDNTLKSAGFRTIWCQDGDKNSDKLATQRRREKREENIADMFVLYLSIIDEMTRKKSDELTSFKRKYAIIEKYLPPDFKPKIMENRLDEMENNLAKLFKNEGFFPPNFSSCMVEGMTSRGIKFFRVPEISEGEKLATILTQTGTAQAIYTTDGDSIVLGARFIIKESKSAPIGEYHLYAYSRIMKELNMSHDDLLKLVILLGNDFNEGVYREGMATCKKYITSETFSIEQHNIQHLGCFNISTCLKELVITKSDYKLVLSHLKNLIA